MGDPHDPPTKARRVRSIYPPRDAQGRFRNDRGNASAKHEETAEPEGPAKRKVWRDKFLAALAATSNISAACAAAGIDSGSVYKLRRTYPAFRTAWRSALLEGYENLELETLGRLREGERRDDERKFDIANALRLLKAHSEAVAAERARREDRDEEDVLVSLDRKIEAMRQRAAAAGTLGASTEDHAG